LFGSRKGAFSGAIEDRPGLIRSAQGGTLFLDEIGDLPLPAQAALLRVLQEREVMPVGGTRPQPVDVRVCAATHRDLAKMARENAFRVDLLSRIAGYTVYLPALRERREDMGLIVAALLRRLAPESAERITFSSDAARTLLQRSWPLNVRELEKRLKVALALAGDLKIKHEHLEASALRDAAPPPWSTRVRLGPEDEERRARLLALLTEHRGNVSAMARAMGSERFQIRRWLLRYQLRAEDFR